MGVVFITPEYFTNEDGLGVITKACGGGDLNDTVWSDVWRGQWKNKMLCQEECNKVQRTVNGSEEYELFIMSCYSFITS